MKKSRKSSRSSNSSHISKSSLDSKRSTSAQKPLPVLKVNGKAIEDDESEDLNSGFGGYLRSPQGVEMMKIFVIANSVVFFLTLALPSLKEIYKVVKEMIFD